MQDSPVSWSAQWIASSVRGGPRATAPAPYFRKVFRVEDPVRAAVLHITALGLYDCEINGRPVTEDVFVPGWTNYHKRVPYFSYEVTGLLSPGENAIGVILGDGWYAGQVGWKDRGQYGEFPMLRAQLEITTQDGAILRIVTDDSWKTTVGPIIESDIILGETYDARHELPGWSSADGDQTGWLPVLIPSQPEVQVARSPGPPVRRQEVLAAQELPLAWRDPRRPCARFDFGQNLTGRVRLAVRGDRGTRLELRHAEILDKGELYTDNLRAARAKDYYVLKGGGTEVWEPRFTFHGFRFAEVSWQGGEAVIEKIEAVVLHSEMARTGTFSCSNPLLNQLEHNIVWGQKGNFLDVPTDCPQRDERLGWTGDAQVFARTAAFHFDVLGFFRKWILDIREAQFPNGGVPSVVPDVFSLGLGMDGGPAWGDATFICPWTMYRCYGDVDIVRDHYDCMARYMDFLAANMVQDFIRAHPDVVPPRQFEGNYGDWLALDGTGRTEGGTLKDLIGTAHYANNARIMREAAMLLGKKDDAARYGELHGKIVDAFQRRFTTADGLLTGNTQTSYVLALHFDLLPESSRATATRELVRLIELNDMHLGTGFVGTPYLLHVLEAQGRLDVAYTLLEQETFPSWLFPVLNGATTIWERWDGWTPAKGFQDKGMNSFNHYAYGAVGDWMVSTVAGLEIGEPGYRKILFKPRPGGTITWAEASLKTPLGLAAIRWDLAGKELKLRLTVPEGSEALLSLPEGWKVKSGPLKTGTHELTAQAA